MPELETNWTLTNAAGQTRKLGSWGAEQAVLSEGRDSFTMHVAQAFDAPDWFAYDERVIVKDPNGIIRFQGRCKKVSGAVTARSDRKVYEFLGLWRELEELTYHRSWMMNVIAGTVVTPFEDFTTEVYLNYDPVTNLLTTVGEQIQAVLEYAITRGVQMQVGDCDLPVQPLPSIGLDVRCADVIRNQMVWAPDAQPHIDYTTTPPTFHFFRRSDLETVLINVANLNNAENIALGNGPFWTATEFTKLDTETVSCVDLRYRYNNTVDGQTYVTRDRDVYPADRDGRMPRALSKTIDLQGSQETRVKARLEVEAIPATDLGLLRSFFPELARGIDAGIITVSDIAIERTPKDPALTGLPNRIVSGTPAPWMDFDHTKETFRVVRTVARKTAAAGVQVEKVVEVDHREIVACDAPVGDYVKWVTSEFTAREPRPVGLAQYLYETLNVADWQGSVTLQGVQNSFLVGTHHLLSLSGTDNPEHATMNAVVQDVVHTITGGAHTTQIICAPKQSLGLDRILELLRAWRTPRRLVNPALITDGTPGADGDADVEFAAAALLENTVPGTKTRTQFSVNDGDKRIDASATDGKLTIKSSETIKSETTPGRVVHTSGTAIIDANTADVTGTAKFRATNICVLVGGVQTTYSVKIMRTAYPGET